MSGEGKLAAPPGIVLTPTCPFCRTAPARPLTEGLGQAPLLGVPRVKWENNTVFVGFHLGVLGQ